MAKQLKDVFKDNKTVLDYFHGCEKKFVSQFPKIKLKKIESPGLYTEFEKILTDPNPRYEYVNSDFVTKSFFGVLKMLPRKWSDMARLGLMRLPK